MTQHNVGAYQFVNGLPGVGISPTAVIDGDVMIGPGSTLGWYSIVRGRVRVGSRLRLGAHATIEGDVTIGHDCTIRGKCEIPNSIIGDRVSIYAGVIFYDTPNPLSGKNIKPIIEDDVTIGCNAAVLGGVRVGAGSFIGARVFLTKSVPPNSFVTLKDPENFKVRPLRDDSVGRGVWMDPGFAAAYLP